MSVGRNDECPCGSGTKFKRCCEGKTAQRSMPRGLVALIGVIIALAGVGFIPVLTGEDEPKRTEVASSAPVSTPVAPLQASAVGVPSQPVQSSAPTTAAAANTPGQPPMPGAEWSVAHGHWHKPGTQQPVTPAASPINIEVDRGPQPVEVGATQAGGDGAVWSQEHGHWHKGVSAPATGTLAKLKQAVANPLPPSPDNPTGLRVGGKPVATAGTPAPGAAPPGQVWSSEHGHWHDIATGAAPVTPAPAAEPKPE